MSDNARVLIKGAGDLATGVGARLWRSGFLVVMTELAQPLTIRRTVAFAEAVYEGEVEVEEIAARRVSGFAEIEPAWQAKVIPILTGCDEVCVASIKPDVLVDATLAKRNIGTRITDAPFVIGLGPGFTVGQDVHAIVETNRGHYLGRVLWSGSAQPDTGAPGDIAGYGRERVIYAPADGVFEHRLKIGARVKAGDVVGLAGQTPVLAPIAGVVRGLIHDGVAVQARHKIGDVDPRATPDHCCTISDKALAIGGGVLEAILIYLRRGKR
jgi:xanthine dehydrogenase accessory factor